MLRVRDATLNGTGRGSRVFVVLGRRAGRTHRENENPNRTERCDEAHAEAEGTQRTGA
jgi:hypothetical protein